MFTFNPKITKEFILTRINQEDIFRSYLNIDVQLHKLYCSKFRADKKPTCGFYKRKNILYFHDFATNEHFNCFNVVMKLYNCSYYKALNIIAKDFKLIDIKEDYKSTVKIKYSENIIEEEKSDTKIQLKFKDFSEEELKWWNSFGVTLSTLKKYRVYSCDSVFLNNVYYTSSSKNNPIFGYYGGKRNDIELWRLYFPYKKNYRFLSNWNHKQIQGIKQLKNKNYCIITKSLKDTMCLYEYDINSCAPNAETIIIPKLQFDKIKQKYNNIFILYDNDLAGVKGANKYKKQYNCKCIFIKRKYAKDISDLYKNLSKSEFLDAISELNYIINNPNIKKTNYFYIF